MIFPSSLIWIMRQAVLKLCSYSISFTAIAWVDIQTICHDPIKFQLNNVCLLLRQADWTLYCIDKFRSFSFFLKLCDKTEELSGSFSPSLFNIHINMNENRNRLRFWNHKMKDGFGGSVYQMHGCVQLRAVSWFQAISAELFCWKWFAIKDSPERSELGLKHKNLVINSGNRV